MFKYTYKDIEYYINMNNISFVEIYKEEDENTHKVQYVVNIVFNLIENVLQFKLYSKYEANSLAEKLCGEYHND